MFRRLYASEVVDHERDHGSTVTSLYAFNKFAGHKQRATMSYLLQATVTTTRIVQTLTRAVKMLPQIKVKRLVSVFREIEGCVPYITIVCARIQSF